MRKLRVAFIIDKWNPGSGTENQLLGMLSHLAPEHVDCHLYTLRTPLEARHRNLFPCPVKCLGIGSLVSAGAVLKLPGIVSELRRMNFDLAMVYFVDSNLYMVPVCRLAGVPAVIVNRRDLGYWYNDRLLGKLNLVNRWATHFLVNAEAVKDQVVRWEHFPADKIQVIPNGMWGHHLFSPRNRHCGSDVGRPRNSDPVVGITASLREVKRLDWFLEMGAKVLEQVPEARFLIAGQGRLQGSLENRARDLGIHDKVDFLGQVEDVPAMLGRLRVAVLTSESEGLSNSLVEYGLAGIPAVAFDVGGNSEVIKEGETGFLVEPGNSGALAERVVSLLTEDDLCFRMGQAAHEHCRTTFAPEKIRDTILKYFHSLVRE